MKKMLLALVFCFPLMVQAQVMDSVEVVRVVDSLLEVVKVFIGERDYESALKINAIAEEIALQHSGDQCAAYGNVCNAYGITYYQKGDNENAEKWYLKAIDVRGRASGKSHPDYAFTQSNLGNLYRSKGNYKQAEALYLEAISTLAKSRGKDHTDYAMVINNLAILREANDDLEDAEKLYQEAISIRAIKPGKKSTLYAGNIINLAGVFIKLTEYSKAEGLLLEAKEIFEVHLKNQKHPFYMNCLNNLAVLYKKIGDYKNAETLYLEVIELRRQFSGMENLAHAKSISNLGDLYKVMGNYKMAEQLLLEALRILEKARGKEHIDYAASLGSLANLYKQIDDFEKAEKLLLEARDIIEKKVGKFHSAYTGNSHNLAGLYYYMGNYEKAILLFEETINIRHNTYENETPDYASSLDALGQAYRKTGDFEKAMSLLMKAKDIRERILGKVNDYYSMSLFNIARLYLDKKDYDSVEPLFCELAVLNRNLQEKATRHLSEVELNTYLQTFSGSEHQIGCFAQFYNYRNTCIIQTCYDNSLFYKGFLFKATSHLRNLANSDSITFDKFNQLKSCERRLSSEYAVPLKERDSTRVAELEEKVNTLRKYLARNLPGYNEAMRQVQWKEIQDKLKPDDASIEFAQYLFHKNNQPDSSLYAALLLRPGWESPKMVYLCEQRQLDSLLNTNDTKAAVQNLYAQRDRRGKRGITPGGQKLSAGLYQLLWQPLDSLLDGVTTVHYSPSGSLHRLAFDAIPTPIEGGKGGVLADRYQLNQLFSTRSLVVKPVTSNATATATLFGGITYDVNTTTPAVAENLTTDSTAFVYEAPLSTRLIPETRSHRGKGWDYLPGTRQEVEKLDALFAKHKIATVTFTGEAATEEQFKALGTTGPSPAILHIATHGFFFPDPALKKERNLDFGGSTSIPLSEHPLMRSGLLLAGANKAWKEGKPFPGREDGILTAYEIAQVNLTGTKLAVLSACETGLGDIQGTEGVMGLQRAFKMAGVEKLIVSLWPVQDIKTAAFMNLFYTKWLTEGKEIRDAFYETQKWMRKKYKDPEVWAGFVLVE